MKLYIIALAKISPNFHHFFGQNFIFSKNHKELLKVAKFAKESPNLVTLNAKQLGLAVSCRE